MISRKRFQNIVVGEEQSGKTYFLEHLAKYNNSLSIAYNYSNPEDFKGFHEVDFLTVGETIKAIPEKEGKRRYQQNPFIAGFRYAGKVYSIVDFSRMFQGCNVRARRIIDKKSENLLFHAFYRYLSDALLIVDDSRAIFRNGLKSGHADLFSRKNHTGADAIGNLKLGTDVCTVLHQVDLVNSELWAYGNYLILFRTNNEPNFKNIQDDRLISVISRCSVELKTAPKFSFFQIGLKGKDYCRTKLLKI